MNAAQKVLSQFAGALPPGSFDDAVLHGHLMLLAALNGAETLANPAREVVRQTTALLGPEHRLTRFVSERLNTAAESEARR
jgi:hypothetical protein